METLCAGYFVINSHQNVANFVFELGYLQFKVLTSQCNLFSMFVLFFIKGNGFLIGHACFFENFSDVLDFHAMMSNARVNLDETSSGCDLFQAKTVMFHENLFFLEPIEKGGLVLVKLDF